MDGPETRYPPTSPPESPQRASEASGDRPSAPAPDASGSGPYSPQGDPEDERATEAEYEPTLAGSFTEPRFVTHYAPDGDGWTVTDTDTDVLVWARRESEHAGNAASHLAGFLNSITADRKGPSAWEMRRILRPLSDPAGV
jgi:hypothetical protein